MVFHAPSSSSRQQSWRVVHPSLHLLVLGLVVELQVPGVVGHGRLLEPPSRSSMWRQGFNNPPNYDDNQLFCGGFSVQWEQYGGKCGVCGDPWAGPRDNEPGGRYANGIITRDYRQGQVIDVHVQLTANHKGYFEFRLCQHDNALTNITQDCLDRHVLKVDSTGETRYMVPTGGGSASQNIRLKLRLPREVICKACVLQWKYNAGNSWGVDPGTHRACVGCGPQEQFYGCADVAIGHDEVVTGVPPRRPTTPWFSTRPTTKRRPGVFTEPCCTTVQDFHNTTDWEHEREEVESEWHYGIAYVFGAGGETTMSSSSVVSQRSSLRIGCLLLLLCRAFFLP